MDKQYQSLRIRDWRSGDREAAANVIKTVLEEYGLPWQPKLADRDVIEVEQAYLQTGGKFWVIEQNQTIVGTAAYQPIARGENAVEIRKMYLLPEFRGIGLGRYLLSELEKAIAIKDYQEIWIETASSLKEAVKLYERNGYQPAKGVETARCDLVYLKRLHHQMNIQIDRKQIMFLLAGDIGGTKTILRLVEVTEVTLTEKTFKTIKEAQYISASFPDLVPMVQEFLAQDEYIKPQLACFAIAGPVVNNTCNLTNLNWVLDTQRLETELNIPKISLLNDFAANSFGILGLKDFDVHTLQEGEAREDSPIAVIGAGTGLGEAFLVPQGKKYQIFASEGGHTDFAPRNDLEMELLKYLRNTIGVEHISVERVVSGQGIASIYQFLRDSGYAEESPEISERIKLWEQEDNKTIDPAAIISQAAFKQSDRLCEKTMDVFIEAYGAETGNLALKLLSYGGIYIAGGIAAKVLPLMQDGKFLSTFKDKGRVSTLIEEVPVHIVLNPQVGLVGSVLYALQNQD